MHKDPKAGCSTVMSKIKWHDKTDSITIGPKRSIIIFMYVEGRRRKNGVEIKLNI